MTDCLFCPSGLREAPVLEDDHCLFLQRHEAVLSGSGLIVPRRHVETPFDFTPAEWEACHRMLLRVKQRLDQESSPDAYNLGWNCGVVAGQEIKHAHLHVIPRFRDEPYAGRGIRYWLKQEENRRNHP